MTTKDQAIAPNKQFLEKFDELLPAPDCRTCWHLHTSDHGDSRYECTSKSDCTNGDKYQPAPKVVLWRTE